MAVTLCVGESVLKLWVSSHHQARRGDVLLLPSHTVSQHSHSGQRMEGVRRPDIPALQH